MLVLDGVSFWFYERFAMMKGLEERKGKGEVIYAAAYLKTLGRSTPFLLMPCEGSMSLT